MIWPRMSGVLHRRQRQRDVVEGDRQPHARAQERVERVEAERGVEGARRSSRARPRAPGTGGGALMTREPTGRRSSRSCSPEWNSVGGECSPISVTHASRSSAVRRVVRWMVVGVPTGRSARAHAAFRRSKTVFTRPPRAARRRVLERGLEVAQVEGLVDQAAGPQAGPASFSAAAELLAVAVGAAELELALPRECEVDGDVPWHADEGHDPARPGGGDAAWSDALEPTQSSTPSSPPSNSSPLIRPTRRRAPVSRAASRCSSSGVQVVVGAEAHRLAALPVVLGDGEHRDVGRELAQRGDRQQAHRPGADDGDGLAGLAARRRVRRAASTPAARRARRPRRRARRARVQLRGGGDEPLAPAAARVAAVADLQPGGQVRALVGARGCLAARARRRRGGPGRDRCAPRRRPRGRARTGST